MKWMTRAPHLGGALCGVSLLGVALVGGGCGGGAPKLEIEPAPAPPLLEWNRDASPEEQMPALRQRAEHFEEEPFWPCELGRMSLAADSFAVADAAFTRALERDPAHVPSASLRASLRHRTGRDETSLEELASFETALLTEGRTWPAELELARALHLTALGQFSETRTSLARAPRLRASDGGSIDAAQLASITAYIELAGDDPRSATGPAQDAASADPEGPMQQNNLGITQLIAGDPERARDSFLHATQLDPTLPGPLYNLAITEQFYFFDSSAAREWYERYLTLDESDPDNLRSVLGPRVAVTESTR